MNNDNPKFVAGVGASAGGLESLERFFRALRSPLHAINAAFQIIDSKDAEQEYRARSEAVVRRQTRQMIRLVDDLLDVSRILHGKLQLERLPINVTKVAPRGEPTAEGKLSIVVVEDQDDAREMLQTLLQMEGHDVAVAHDGVEGLAAILQKRPQIGLLDIGLPRMNGYDLAVEARKHLGRSIKLVAMSGYGQSDDVRKAEAAGFDRHLTKPVDARRLAAALRELGVDRGAITGPHAVAVALRRESEAGLE